MNDKKDGKERKPMIYFYFVMLALLLLANAFIFPMLAKQSVKEVDYNTFLQMVGSGQVATVEVESTKITFYPSDTTDTNTYITGNMNDPDLVSKLQTAGVSYKEVIPTVNSPLANFLIN